MTSFKDRLKRARSERAKERRDQADAWEQVHNTIAEAFAVAVDVLGEGAEIENSIWGQIALWYLRPHYQLIFYLDSETEKIACRGADEKSPRLYDLGELTRAKIEDEIEAFLRALP